MAEEYAGLRDQINEAFFADNEELAEEVWEACKNAGMYANHSMHRLLAEVVEQHNNLPTAGGDRSEIVGLLPGAQFLMAAIGTAGALLDSILFALSAGVGKEGGPLPLKDQAHVQHIRDAVSKTIVEIRKTVGKDIEKSLKGMQSEDEE